LKKAYDRIQFHEVYDIDTIKEVLMANFIIKPPH